MVSRGRQLSKDKVDKIAQGQVWLGQDAQKNGLVDELGDIDVAIDKVVALVNQHPDKYMDNFSVQWLVDEDNSFFAKLDRKLKQKGQALLTSWLELPQEVHQVKKQLNVLSQFNDPKGQYLYCFIQLVYFSFLILEKIFAKIGPDTLCQKLNKALGTAAIGLK